MECFSLVDGFCLWLRPILVELSIELLEEIPSRDLLLLGEIQTLSAHLDVQIERLVRLHLRLFNRLQRLGLSRSLLSFLLENL